MVLSWPLLGCYFGRLQGQLNQRAPKPESCRVIISNNKGRTERGGGAEEVLWWRTWWSGFGCRCGGRLDARGLAFRFCLRRGLADHAGHCRCGAFIVGALALPAHVPIRALPSCSADTTGLTDDAHAVAGHRVGFGVVEWVAVGCGLAPERRRWRWALAAVRRCAAYVLPVWAQRLLLL